MDLKQVIQDYLRTAAVATVSRLCSAGEQIRINVNGRRYNAIALTAITKSRVLAVRTENNQWYAISQGVVNKTRNTQIRRAWKRPEPVEELVVLAFCYVQYKQNVQTNLVHPFYWWDIDRTYIKPTSLYRYTGNLKGEKTYFYTQPTLDDVLADFGIAQYNQFLGDGYKDLKTMEVPLNRYIIPNDYYTATVSVAGYSQMGSDDRNANTVSSMQDATAQGILDGLPDSEALKRDSIWGGAIEFGSSFGLGYFGRNLVRIVTHGLSGQVTDAFCGATSYYGGTGQNTHVWSPDYYTSFYLQRLQFADDGTWTVETTTYQENVLALNQDSTSTIPESTGTTVVGRLQNHLAGQVVGQKDTTHYFEYETNNGTWETVDQLTLTTNLMASAGSTVQSFTSRWCDAFNPYDWSQSVNPENDADGEYAVWYGEIGEYATTVIRGVETPTYPVNARVGYDRSQRYPKNDQSGILGDYWGSYRVHFDLDAPNALTPEYYSNDLTFNHSFYLSPQYIDHPDSFDIYFYGNKALKLEAPIKIKTVSRMETFKTYIDVKSEKEVYIYLFLGQETTDEPFYQSQHYKYMELYLYDGEGITLHATYTNTLQAGGIPVPDTLPPDETWRDGVLSDWSIEPPSNSDEDLDRYNPMIRVQRKTKFGLDAVEFDAENDKFLTKQTNYDYIQTPNAETKVSSELDFDVYATAYKPNSSLDKNPDTPLLQPTYTQNLLEVQQDYYDDIANGGIDYPYQDGDFLGADWIVI